MSNNDPIKEYNSVSFKLEKIREKFEMRGEKEESITDLHDCSNDLSDKGSKLEELEHANFAENLRKKLNQHDVSKNDVWNNKYEKNKKIQNYSVTSNSLTVIIVIVIIVFIFLVNIITSIIGGVINLTEEVIEDFIIEFDDSYNTNSEVFEDLEDKIEEKNYDYSVEYNDITELEEKINFDIYSDKIECDTLETMDGKLFLKLYNKNEKNFEDLKIKMYFYDINSKLVNESILAVNTLFAKEEHYYEIYMPYEWENCKHEFLTEKVKISSVTKEGIILENNILKRNNPFGGEYISGDIILTNKTDKTIERAEILVKYLKDGKIQKIDTHQLYSIIPGENSTNYASNYDYVSEIDEIELSINELNLY